MSVSKWSGYSFLAFDPGIQVTGWSHQQISLTGVPTLNTWGCYDPPDIIESLDERIAFITDELQGLVNVYKPGFVYVEVPPATLYHQGKLSRDGLIARAQSLFKTVAVAYSIVAVLRLMSRLKVRTILPSQWQAHAKKRKGFDSKQWSLMVANQIVMKECSKGANHFTTAKHENIADAITLGRMAFLNGHFPL